MYAVNGPFDYQVVVFMERQEDGMQLLLHIALGQKGRCKMQLFKILMVVMSLLWFCFLVDSQMPTSRADFTFGPRVDLGPNVNSPQNEGIPVIARNGLELYFTSTRPGGYADLDIWMSKRASVQDPWVPAVNLGPGINSADKEFVASISSDGLTLYFYVGTWPNHDLYTTTRPTLDAPWGARVSLGPVVNSAASDQSPIISPDYLELYFGSQRGGGLGLYDIYVSTRATRNDPWGPPVNLGPPVNTADVEIPSAISPDGLVLFFVEGTRPGGFGGWDTWMTLRPYKGAPWSAPVNLGPSFNTAGNELLTSVSADGRWAYVYELGSDALPFGDLWMAPILPIVDFNGDGKVDGKDVLCMVAHWGTDDPVCDIGPFAWGDGTVDLQDLVVLADYLGKEIVDPTLIAHWKLDETEGTTAMDSASGKDGFVLGDAVWQPEGGQVGGALQLDGIDDCVITPFILNPADEQFSVFVWIKNGAAGQVILSQEDGVNWLMADSIDGALRTDLKEPASGGRDPKPSGPPLICPKVVTDGDWHRVGFVRDGINRILYVDDVEVARDTATSLEAGSGGMYIGAGSSLEPGTFWSGLIDDVRIYKRTVHP
jgi:hypothetical protein